MQEKRKYSDDEIVVTLSLGRNLDDVIRFMYHEFYAGLSWFVLNNQGSTQDAEDIFQDVMVNFISIVQQDKFLRNSSVKTFLYSLNRFSWLNELKRRGRALTRERRYEAHKGIITEDITGLIFAKESLSQVTVLISQLGDNCRKILMMFYFQECSMKEILNTLDYENEQVVRNKKYKCLKQLEKIIADTPGAGETLKKILHGYG